MADKKVSSLTQNEDFKGGMEIVRDYIKYIINRDLLIDEKIDDLLRKCDLNVIKSQEILKDFTLVRFTFRDGGLYVEPFNNPHNIRFKIDSLTKRNDDRPIRTMIQKRIDEYKKELEVVEKIEDDQRMKIDNLEIPQAKKKWKFFRDREEEDRIAKDFYKKLKAENRELEKIQHQIETTQFQIDCNQSILDDMIRRNNFLASLKPSEKKSILEHYELIKHLFDENERLYLKMKDLRKSKTYVPSLKTYVESHLQSEQQEQFLRLVENLNKEYETVRYFKKKGSNKNEVLRKSHLTSRVDFGDYNGLVDVVTNQMSGKESVSLPTCEVVKGEEFSR